MSSNKPAIFFYPVDGPWWQAESMHARNCALARFKELCKIYEYVVIIKTIDRYWVQTQQTVIKDNEYILKEYRPIICLIQWDHLNGCQIFEKLDCSELKLLHNIYNFEPLYGFKIKSSKKQNYNNANDNI